MPGFTRSAVFQPMPTAMSCWTGSASLRKSPSVFFVMHGEEETALSFAKTIQEQLNLDAYAPEMMEEMQI